MKFHKLASGTDWQCQAAAKVYRCPRIKERTVNGKKLCNPHAEMYEAEIATESEEPCE